MICVCMLCTAPGIFSLLEMLDFGLLRTMDDPAVLRLNVINSGLKPIQIVVSPMDVLCNLMLYYCCDFLNSIVTGRQKLWFWSLFAPVPYLTLPLGWAGCYTCPALRPYQFGPMRNPDVTRRSQ